ncbi:hypothetical protein SAMN05421882_10354 [Nitrosomonas communis]|uniref:Uncharacterized protein n=1 Tax=Nitrosomonas communis TaxID=44574 RepID=A0A1H2X5Z4_9PROT|nr:hypothetical protein SAMN05421882_10354 [Nitrosomonas communis]
MVGASSGFGNETTIELTICRIEVLEVLAAEITNGIRIRERMRAKNETRKVS